MVNLSNHTPLLHRDHLSLRTWLRWNHTHRRCFQVQIILSDSCADLYHLQGRTQIIFMLLHLTLQYKQHKCNIILRYLIYYSENVHYSQLKHFKRNSHLNSQNRTARCSALSISWSSIWSVTSSISSFEIWWMSQCSTSSSFSRLPGDQRDDVLFMVVA